MPAPWEQRQRGAAAPCQDRVLLAHPGHGLHLNGLSAGSKVVFPEDDNVAARAARGKRESGPRVQPAPRVGAALAQPRARGTPGKPPWGPLGRKPRAARAFGADPSATQRCPHTSGTSHRSLLEIAVGSCDNPVLIDQGAAAEVGSCGGLGREEGTGAGARGAEYPQAGDRQRSPWCATVAAGWPCQGLGQCPGSGMVLYLQGHLPGPGAGHSVLPIDNPLTVGDRGTDGRHPAACRRGTGDKGDPKAQDSYLGAACAGGCLCVTLPGICCTPRTPPHPWVALT